MKKIISKTIGVATAQLCILLPVAADVSAAVEAENEYLDMGLAQLMQMTVTSVSKKPQTLADTAAAVFIITQEDIRRSGVTSIPEALAMAPGIQVARISSSKWSISARGFGGYTSNKLLVLMDGRSVYSPAHSGAFWDMQNTLLEDIDRIEVIRGPGGTIWGANAVNGVINIITKKAQDTLGTLVRAGAGNEEKLSAGARHGCTLGESAFGRFYFTTNDRDSNELSGSGRDAYDSWRNIQGGFRMDGMAGARNQWNLQGDIFRNKGDEIVYPYWFAGPPYLGGDYGDLDGGGGNLTGSWQHKFSGGDLLTFKAYYDRTDRDEAYLEQNFDTVDLDLQYETRLGERNSLTMGAGFRQVDGEFTGTYQMAIPDQTNELYSVFLQDEIKLLAERLWLTLGAKFEHNDFTGYEWQPSARLLWKPAVDHSLWVSATHAVRTPSLLENSGKITMASSPAQEITLLGNPDFESEILNAYEAGYRWQAARNFSLDVALYYNDYDEIYSGFPDTITDPTEINLLFTNAKQGEGHGLEVSANWLALSRLSFYLTYTWQELKLELQDPSMQDEIMIDDTFFSDNYPKHQISLRSSYDFADNWQFNGWLRYVSKISGRSSVNYASVPVSSYYLADANLIWKPRKDMEIMFAAQNLFNSSQLEYVAEIITPATEIERSFYGKITWRF